VSRLPQPELERWQPLRAGLVDLFYYDHEEFRFRDGRLLLRGNNGTGKSKVLALTLPFLLDGDLSPHRVEPDADPNKRMEWNLLLGGEHPAEDRLGYTWLELGCRADDGEARFLTLGCGLKAARGRGMAAHWFFVTDQRVGEELTLIDGTGIALSRDRLEAAIGTQGAVHRTAREYRRTVDERLFGLGEQRYGALIDLLIRIRAPQLSRRPDERGLSQALTDALPPLDQALIADVAEAFRALEEDRDALAAMIEARDASARYLETYRAYARIASRRRAAPLRQAQTAFDRVSRELSEAEAGYGRARNELEAAEAELASRRARSSQLNARQQALRESPEARSAREFERAADEARRAAERAAKARSAVERAEQRVALEGERLAEAKSHREQTEAALQTARATAIGHVRAARVEAEFAQLLEATADQGALDQLRRQAGELADRQQRAIEHMRQLLDALDDCRRRLAAAREHHDEVAGQQAELAEGRERATERLVEVAGDYLRQVREHIEGAVELTLDDPAGALAALTLWIETLAGPNPLPGAIAGAGRATSDVVARAEEKLSGDTAEAVRKAAELDASIARLQAGEQDSPPAPYTRDAASREHRAGAPLWQVVDFRAGVPDAERAGIEAALEAAGILDAWVSPDGELVAPGTFDVLLAPKQSSALGGPCLGDVLEPMIDRENRRTAGFPENAVARVLAAIGLADSDAPVWVAPDGQFRNGVLRGRWHKPAAAFIGHGAREAARRERLEELRSERATVGEHLAELERARLMLGERRARLEAELERTPDDEALRGAHAEVIRLEAGLARVRERAAVTDARVQDAQAEERAAEGRLLNDAEDLALPADASGLDEVHAALQALREALAGLWPALLADDRAGEAALRGGADLDRAHIELSELGADLGAAELELTACDERHQTLVRTAGAAVAELQRRLSAVAEELSENESLRDAADQRRSTAQREEGGADSLRRQLQRELDQAAENRLGAIDALRRFASTGLIEVALGGVELPETDEGWGVTAALRLARQIQQELSDVQADDAAWQRAQQRANDELGALADALRRHGNNASASLREEGITVEVTFRAHRTTVPALAAALNEEVADRQRLLDEREREILENHLVNEVASTLQELITDAERQLARTNAELAARPTSTGMQLRLRWVVDSDGPQGLTEARERLLRQTADAWSEDDRAAVGAFLQARIQEVRSRDAGGTWIEHLIEALDYRAWHRFTVERRQAGGWRSATGPSSGGERVLAASIPLFAAASSYYSSAANIHAPRLVMLDEAFAGVDDNARAKCLGLLAAFDLDVVMTSEREWGCYPEVPGLAIAQLARVEDVAAVLVTHWEWDGAARTRVERPVVPLVAGAPARDDESSDGPQLWETSTASD
jgi:uncharacterized protein (TIGR02680 family)